MACKQPRRSHLTSDLKYMAQTTYATMFVWTVLDLLLNFLRKKERKKEDERTPLISTRVVGFAATKNNFPKHFPRVLLETNSKLQLALATATRGTTASAPTGRARAFAKKSSGAPPTAPPAPTDTTTTPTANPATVSPTALCTLDLI